MKLLYLVSHPIQYQAPLLRLIAKEPLIELKVLFRRGYSKGVHLDPGFGVQIQWDVPLIEGYQHEFIEDELKAVSPYSWRQNVRYWKRKLTIEHPDALWLHGYNPLTHTAALYVARSMGIKTLLRTDSHLGDRRRSILKQLVKRLILPRIFSRVDAFLCIGTLNKKYFRYYGAAEQKLHLMPYAVDNEYFSSRAKKAEKTKSDLKKELSIEEGRPIILFASKLISRKRPNDLLQAFLGVAQMKTLRPYLLFVGEGPQRAALEKEVARTGNDSIRFLGFRNQSELPICYSLCDLFVLPSIYEPWGLIVNEVMACGKVVVVSDEVGCSPDLIQNGLNGFCFQARSVPSLRQVLQKALERLEGFPLLEQRAKQTMEFWSFEQDIKVLRGVFAQLGAKPQEPGSSWGKRS